ncbi:methyltransferase-like protein 17, mitochondrial [Gouania willdenowi]|uniref:Ribosome assembly protein METTL17, mitochondrial n=1 Tax=Gouania willdenowi TaxID=441366 RepID=A0A8C5HH68_GOUWI|nr:methyltransferase-like protein 17, mitochondrial [Gouania willdenowi]
MASRSYKVCVVCLRTAVSRTVCRGVSTAASPQTSVDILKGKPHRKHDGVINLKTLRLPEELQNAARSIIYSSQVKQLSDHTKKLTNYLWSRKRLVDNQTLRQKAVSLEKEMWEKAMQTRTDIDDQAMSDHIRRKVLTELKRTTYHWTPLRYDEELGVVYMASRLAGGYAAVKRSLNEIKKRDPTFAPQTLLDFGSGLGTVAWASHSYWGDSLKEMVCVDSSGPMNILAERLLKGDDEKAEPHIKHVYFRHFLPVSPKVQFDLVVAAFTLSELQGVKDREDAVFTLWRKTSSYLVLIENGTMEGHQMLMEARDTLLKKREAMVHDPRPASVFAPCSHELKCPKLAQRPFLPCNFQQPYHPLHLPGRNERQTEKFSYLIMKRSEPVEAEAETEGVEWARVVAPVLRRTRHVHCRMCCPDGQLQNMVVTAGKHGRDVYRCARNSDWGDQVPIIQRIEEDENEEDEIQKDGDAE